MYASISSDMLRVSIFVLQRGLKKRTHVLIKTSTCELCVITTDICKMYTRALVNGFTQSIS